MKIFKNKVVLYALAIIVIGVVILWFLKEKDKPKTSAWQDLTHNLDSFLPF